MNPDMGRSDMPTRNQPQNPQRLSPGTPCQTPGPWPPQASRRDPGSSASGAPAAPDRFARSWRCTWDLPQAAAKLRCLRLWDQLKPRFRCWKPKQNFSPAPTGNEAVKTTSRRRGVKKKPCLTCPFSYRACTGRGSPCWPFGRTWASPPAWWSLLV